jgi:hypothetical protein
MFWGLIRQGIGPSQDISLLVHRMTQQRKLRAWVHCFGRSFHILKDKGSFFVSRNECRKYGTIVFHTILPNCLLLKCPSLFNSMNSSADNYLLRKVVFKNDMSYLNSGICNNYPLLRLLCIRRYINSIALYNILTCIARQRRDKHLA